MKPRNKFEKAVAELNATLSEDISAESLELVKNDCDSWGMRINPQGNQVGYFTIFGSIKEWEVNRIYRLYKRESKSITHYFVVEIMRVFKDGSNTLFFSKARTIGGCYYDTFSYGSEITLKSTYRNYAGNSIEDLPEYSYKSFPELCGERVACLNINPNEVIRVICDNPVGENLYKNNNPLFDYLIFNAYPKQLCRAITIAKRHGFEFNENTTAIWFDMVRAIIYCKKDFHNPVYVAPKNLMETHDMFVEMRSRKKAKDEDRRRRARLERIHREEVERLKTKMEKDSTDNDNYIKRRKRFYDMVLTDGLIECRVLPDVKAFLEEGTALQHCVYRCEYYKKVYSLILSARINGRRLETIEVDLTSFQIKQCYGKNDQFTMYHNRIKDLVNSQMETIKRYYKSRTRKTKVA